MNLDDYKHLFLDHLTKNSSVKEPKNLYEPIDYILNLGGKRLRPILVLMSCDLFGGNPKKALDAAVAIEMFHNFTLIHDDIMDKAPLRRGCQTVHNKWNLETGILSGDALMILAYKMFDAYNLRTHKSLLNLFNQTALALCEGQQLDMDFETQTEVSLSDYLKMISYKTSVLIAAALKMGAIIAKANETDAQNIYNFGLNLGIAFQLQDDYLDVFSETDFGKQKAGDIIENKKTFLYLKCLELASESDKKILLNLFSQKQNHPTKVAQVVALYNKYELSKVVKLQMDYFTTIALKYVNKLTVADAKKELLRAFSKHLMQRTL